MDGRRDGAVMSPRRIQLLYRPGCPNVDRARRLLYHCLDEAGVQAEVEELAGDYPSPTILVDGVDVMGGPGGPGPACRLDLPTEERVLATLTSS
jgi:hypothetical protein